MTFSQGIDYSTKALADLKVQEAQFKMDATSTLANPSSDLVHALMGIPASAGKPVTRSTALRVAAFLAGVRQIANDLAKMDLILRETSTVAGRYRTQPALTDPLYPLLRDCPNHLQTSTQSRL